MEGIRGTRPLSAKHERLEALEQICVQCGVVALYAFGSQAKEVSDWLTGVRPEMGPSFSDVDIGAKAVVGVTWSVAEKVRVAVALEDLLRCPRVDLVVLDEADAFLAADVIRGERLFARDQHAADEYDLFVLRRAGDLAPLERDRMTLVLGELG